MMKAELLTYHKLEPGKYWVGDPCYVFPRDKWGNLCDTLYELDIQEINNGVIFEYNNIPFFVCVTAYGDGSYALMRDWETVAELGVDAGLLSVIPLGLVELWKEHTDLEDFGAIITLTESCDIRAEHGNFSFGEYYVNTTGTDYEDEEEDDWDDDDEEED